MKTKLQFIALASLAVMGAGCLAVTAGVTSNQNSQLSLNAETINETIGNVRIWFSSDPNAPLEKDGATPVLWFHNTYEGGGDVLLAKNPQKVINSAEGDRVYWYFDVDANNILGKYVSVQRYNEDGTVYWNNTSKALLINPDTLNQVIYQYGDWSTVACGVVGSTDAYMAAKAVEGLQTCSSSNVNGFNAFPQIAKTFILNENGDWKLPSGQNLDQVEISDYASIDDYATGKRTITVNAYDKAVILARTSNVTLHKN